MTDTVRTLAEFQALLHPNIQNGMPDATVLQSQTARDLLISLPTLAGVPFVVVDGDPYPQTPAGIQAAINSLGGTSGTVVLAAGIYTLAGTKITITSSEQSLIGVGPGTVLKLPATTASVPFLQINGGGLTISRPLNASPAIGQNIIVLTAGSVAALGLAQYDYIRLDEPIGGGDVKSQVTQVLNIAGETLTLADPLKETFTTGSPCAVYKVFQPISNVLVGNFAVDGNGNSGAASNFIEFNYAINCVVSDIWATRTPQAIVYTETTYGQRIQNIISNRCGSDQISAIEIFRGSNGVVQNWINDNGPPAGATGGFGIGLYASNGYNMSDCYSSYTNGRNFKLYLIADCHLVNCEGHNSLNATGGFLLAGHDNSMVGCSAWHNADYGLAIGGDNNVISACNFRYNLVGATADIWIFNGALSSGNRIDAIYDSILDQGVNTVLIAPPWKTWTPIVTQTGVISGAALTVDYARYWQEGKIVHAQTALTIANGAGAVAGASVLVSLPVNAVAGIVTFNAVIGVAKLFDSSANLIYTGNVVVNTAGDVYIQEQGNGVVPPAILGSTATVGGFAAALAVNDRIWIDATYEAA